MSAGEATAFIALTVAVLGAMATFAWSWLQLPDRGTQTTAWLVATLLLTFHTGSWVARWLALAKMRRPVPLSPQAGARVAVATAFVPGAEPIEMLEQTVRALVALEYPHDTWVLDEIGDPAVRDLCRRLGAEHFSRSGLARYQADRGRFARGTKYGNYNAWLDAVGFERYDYVAAFDVDHVPEPGFLVRVLGYFRDPAVGYVQAPQSYYNQDASFIARGAAEETYAYHSAHQMASFALGHPVIVGGHNTHRVTALREVGGFAPHDADDLLLTLLYRVAGWRGVFVPEILALGITAVDWRGYLRQQTRWARTMLDVKLRAYPRVAGRMSVVDRLLTLLHGSYFLRSVTLPVMYALLIGLLLTGAHPTFLDWSWGAGLAVVAALLHLGERFRQRFFLDPRRERGLHWRSHVLQLAKWPFFVVAIWSVARRQTRGYDLTIKVGSEPQRRVLQWPHLTVAAMTAAAWLIGRASHGPIASSLTVCAAAVIVLSVSVVLTEARAFPAPFEPERYARRRAELTDLLGPSSP